MQTPMMTPLQFVQVLQLTDSFFPVGAFAYSDGLETAATNGAVKDASTLRNWLDHFLDNVFVPCDGLALFKSVESIERRDFQAVHEIDEELTAIKPSAALRNASQSIGKRLLTAYAGISGDPEFDALVRLFPHCNAPVAYAAVMTHRGIEGRDALLAFGYSRLAGIVSAGLRLISIGQQQAQGLLSEVLERLPSAADRIVQNKSEPLRSFAPFMDITQMNHRYVYSRLFRS
jgi:urease accessory protein